MGTSWAFFVALAVVVVWAITGPFFRFSDTWQLVINTGTTVVTFLMVFVIQSTQNRDAMAIHLKIDELLRAIREARTNLVDLEEMPDEELCRLKEEFQSLSHRLSRASKTIKAPSKSAKRSEDSGNDVGLHGG